MRCDRCDGRGTDPLDDECPTCEGTGRDWPRLWEVIAVWVALASRGITADTSYADGTLVLLDKAAES